MAWTYESLLSKYCISAYEYSRGLIVAYGLTMGLNSELRSDGIALRFTFTCSENCMVNVKTTIHIVASCFR